MAAALDHSGITSFPAMRRFQPSTGGVNQAREVSLPPGAARVSINNLGSTEARVADSGDDGVAIATDYDPINPGDSLDDLDLRQDDAGTRLNAPMLYVSSGSTTEWVTFTYQGA